MKILIDENLTPHLCPFLASAGFDAIHWTQVGSRGAPDTEIMAYARDAGFVVFTHDLDFGHLLALTRAKGPSVIQLRAQDTLPSAVGKTVLTALEAHRAALDAGALLTHRPRRRSHPHPPHTALMLPDAGPEPPRSRDPCRLGQPAPARAMEYLVQENRVLEEQSACSSAQGLR